MTLILTVLLTALLRVYLVQRGKVVSLDHGFIYMKTLQMSFLERMTALTRQIVIGDP